MLSFVVNVLAVWRITSLLVNERCPFALCEKFRAIMGEIEYNEYSIPSYPNEISAALGCARCTSVWVAFLIAKGNLKTTLALSAGALVVDRWVNG